jgi:transcriptional regulator with XRE-family HTH domain
MAETIGGKIREARKSEGMKLREISELARAPIASISRLERSKSIGRASFLTVSKLAHVLGLDLNELAKVESSPLDGAEPDPSSPYAGWKQLDLCQTDATSEPQEKTEPVETDQASISGRQSLAHFQSSIPQRPGDHHVA